MTKFRSSAAMLVVCTAPLAAQFPAPVRVAAVELRQIAPHDRVTGSLRAAQQAVLAALEEGSLVEVLVKEAAQVKAGDVLARTDARRLESMIQETQGDLERARAEIRQSQAELQNAEADVEAMTAAAADKAISLRDLRTARMQAAVASARLAAASSFVAALSGRLALLRVRLEDTFVRAPFAGRVTVRHAEPGEWVQAGDPIVTLISIPVEAWLEVPERHLAAMRRLDGGFDVELTAAGSRSTAAKPRVVPQVHERARTFHFVGDLPNEDGALLPGMSVSAWLPVGAPVEHLVVPRDAIVRRPGTISLFVVRDGEHGPFADQVPVQIRFETPDGIAVDAGPALHAGDQVIVEGNERILPRAPVVVLPAGGEPREATGSNGGDRKETAGR